MHNREAMTPFFSHISRRRLSRLGSPYKRKPSQTTVTVQFVRNGIKQTVQMTLDSP